MIKQIKTKEKYSIIISILMIILAILLIVDTDNFIQVVSIIFGVSLTIEGISILVIHYKYKNNSKTEVVNGIITIILGLLLIFYYQVFISLITVIIGLWIVVSNLDKMLISIYLRELDRTWIPELVISILMIILGIVVVINPFDAVLTTSIICGIIILISELVNLIESIYLLIKLK